VCFLAGFAACGADDTTDDGRKKGDAAGIVDAGVGGGIDGADATPTDVAIADTGEPDTGEPDAGQPDVGPVCPGGPGCACSQADDCDNAMCIETPAGKRCALSCVDTCPAGFTCTAVTAPGGDAITICTPRWTRLCDPCTNSKACPALALGKSACVNHGDAGS